MFFGEKFGANVTEEIDQGFSGCAHRAIFLIVPKLHQVLDLSFVEGQGHTSENLANRV